MKGRYTVLVVEQNGDYLGRILVAFVKASPRVCVSIAVDEADARRYLVAEGLHADDDEFPLPQLVVLDLDNESASGLDLLAWLKRNPQLARIPVLVLAVPGCPKIEQAFSLGANSWLPKTDDDKAILEMAQAVGVYAMLLQSHPEKAGASSLSAIGRPAACNCVNSSESSGPSRGL